MLPKENQRDHFQARVRWENNARGVFPFYHHHQGKIRTCRNLECSRFHGIRRLISMLGQVLFLGQSGVERVIMSLTSGKQRRKREVGLTHVSCCMF